MKPQLGMLIFNRIWTKHYYTHILLTCMHLKTTLEQVFILFSGGVWTHRWGDAPVKTLAVPLFVPQAHVHCFKVCKDVKYQHRSHVFSEEYDLDPLSFPCLDITS